MFLGENSKHYPHIFLYLRKDRVDMHVVALLGNFYYSNLINNILFKQRLYCLGCCFPGGSFTYSDQYMIPRYYHHITAFQRYLLLIAVSGHQESVKCIGQLNNLITKVFEKCMVKENVFSE